MAKFDSTRFSFELVHDSDCPDPSDCDGFIKIAYLSSSRYTLGNEPVSRDRMDEIAEGLRKGDLLGVEVYAYVHSGVALRAGSSWHGLLPQGHAEFDSGMSGFAYVDKREALRDWYGRKRWSKKLLAKANESILACFSEYASWLGGDCYGYIIKDDEDNEYDSCWGFVGHEYATEEAEAALKRVIDEQRKEHEAEVRGAWKERGERRYWASRDVLTAGVWP